MDETNDGGAQRIISKVKQWLCRHDLYGMTFDERILVRCGKCDIEYTVEYWMRNEFPEGGGMK